MILVNNPGSWSHIYSPLEHAAWHGCTPTDLVFPFFLFAVGNALAFVMPRFEQSGTPAFLKKVLKRTLLIITIGLFLNWSPFVRWDGDHLVGKAWDTIRIMGVLQRIALCYLLAALLIYFCKTKGAFVISCVLLLLYWFMGIWLGAPDNPFSLAGYFGTAIDINALGVNHIYKGEGVPFDPEGLTSTFPAVVQVVFGYLAGQYIQQKGKSFEMLSHLFITAVLLTLAGYCWDMTFPINKKIWSSSYVLYTTGLAMFTLTSLIFLIEFKGVKGSWTRFFDVFGKNPLFIFVLSGFLPRLLGLIRIRDHYTPEGKPVYLSPFGWFYEHICKPVSPDLRNGSLLYALIMILFYWSIVYLLDKKRIYIKV
jgi:predicted acyltransferase